MTNDLEEAALEAAQSDAVGLAGGGGPAHKPSSGPPREATPFQHTMRLVG